jgi:hypothetical protein
VRRVLLGVAVVVLVAAAGGALVYRATGPRLEGGGAATSGIGVTGELRGFGYQIWSDDGLRIDDVDVVGMPDDAVDVWVNRDRHVHLGSFGGDASRYDLRPARGQWIAGSRLAPLDLVVTFTATRPATYRITHVRVTYGSGLRRRTTTLPFDVCFAALDRAGGRPVQPCDGTAKEGIVFGR